MRLFLKENLVTGNTLTPDGVLAYIALRKMMDENIFLKSLEITEDCVSINRMAYTLVGVSEKYPKAFTDALQRGIYELDAVDKIKIVQSFGKGIEFVLDVKNLYFDTSKDGQHFVMVSSDEVEKILTHDADMKKKISILKYYVALVSSFDWSANMKCKDGMPNLQGKIGHMTQDYVGGLAGISGRTCQRYNVVLEDEMKMIYIYRSNDKIKEDDSLRQITNCYSRYEDNACSYPVYDDMGEYIAFIEHWTDAYTAISFWNVYYPTYVEHWDNEGGEMRLTSTDNSVGLPIHYHNFNDEDYNFGVALLNDIKPIMDALEDVMAKMSDSIYVNVMNPMPVAIGQRIESSIPADAVGYVMNLDVGDFKYANCSLDYNSIKLYLDNMKQFLNDVACMPSVLGSSTNIANISEVSMQILLMMASVYADENKKWLNIGFQKRFEMFKKILGMQGIKVDSDVEVIYNVAMPVASTEMIANLKALQEMGAISKETIMEKTEYVSDVEVEKKRLSGENVSQNVSQKVDNPSKEVGIK